MRTNEYIYILQFNLGKDLGFESVPTETEWGTTFYEIVLYHIPTVKKIIKKTDRVAQFFTDGIAAAMDCNSVCATPSMEESVDEFFNWCLENNLIK